VLNEHQREMYELIKKSHPDETIESFLKIYQKHIPDGKSDSPMTPHAYRGLKEKIMQEMEFKALTAKYKI
jgi:hypothetical protein